MGIYADLNKDIQTILLKLVNNANLAKLIYYTGEDSLDRPLVPKPSSLLYTQVFPYRYIPKIASEVKTYLCVGFPSIRKASNNTLYKYTSITFYAICHKDDVLTNQGIRYNCMLDEVENLVNSGAFKNIGWLSLKSAGETYINDDFVCYATTYEICDN